MSAPDRRRGEGPEAVNRPRVPARAQQNTPDRRRGEGPEAVNRPRVPARAHA